MQTPSNDPELILSERGLVGYKQLNVSQNTSLLLSLAHNFIWKPNTFQTAVCSISAYPTRQCSRPVGTKCTCGIYSAKSIEHLQKINYMQTTIKKGEFQIVVKLRLWGRIEECTLGWRAEHASIEEILFVCSDELNEEHLSRAADFEATYGVPCTIFQLPEYRKGETENEYPTPRPAKPLSLQECIELYTMREELDLKKTELSIIKQRLRQFIYHKTQSEKKLSVRIQSFINQRAKLQNEITKIYELLD